tara:strand:+ start:68966 stop:69988 length:1023 start_codon:yes stop_codon:yes gene_type:complete
MMNQPRSQKGISLIELMVAMLLGLILTLGIIEIFISSKQMYRVQDARARLQENGRFAVQLLADKIKVVDYNGCNSRSASVSITNTLNNSSDYLWNFTTSIQGVEATGLNIWTPTIDASVTGPISGSDVLTLRGTANPVIEVTAHPGGSPPGSANIKVTGGSGLNQFDIVMVSDCLAAAIFQITHINSSAGDDNIVHNTALGTPGNSTKTLGKNYTGAELIKLVTTSYYIRNNASGVPSLYQKVFNDAPQELVEGVESMQILYGVDTNDDASADQYISANAVGNWNNVTSVKVSLLVRTSEDNLTVDGPQQYLFNNANVVATDRRLRAVYTRTVTLRNRVP